MARPRKPDALSNAERHRRYAQSHDLVTAKVPRMAFARLAAIASKSRVTYGQALSMLLDAWEAAHTAISHSTPPPPTKATPAAQNGRPPGPDRDSTSATTRKPRRPQKPVPNQLPLL
jgi:hypothetical protein